MRAEGADNALFWHRSPARQKPSVAHGCDTDIRAGRAGVRTHGIGKNSHILRVYQRIGDFVPAIVSRAAIFASARTIPEFRYNRIRPAFLSALRSLAQFRNRAVFRPLAGCPHGEDTLDCRAGLHFLECGLDSGLDFLLHGWRKRLFKFQSNLLVGLSCPMRGASPRRACEGHGPKGLGRLACEQSAS